MLLSSAAMSNSNSPSDQEAAASSFHEPKAKKKRSQPGNPDPDAEVIALSPRTLVTTNRFVCEICNKGFQRDQNLQLHRRGHNLPWKLRQRSSSRSKEEGVVVRKRVYVCPVPSCVHHDPSRALGDLTGIKKHFSRKHGEKRWSCERCSKKYAVHSDWKAHVKNCGTREYRCDCGILFSRKDSLITHRAFCDALAEESARLLGTSTTANNNSNSNSNRLFLNNSLFLPFSSSNPNPNSPLFLPEEPLPPILHHSYFNLPTMATTTTTSTSQLSAAALIQKAPAMGTNFPSCTGGGGANSGTVSFGIDEQGPVTWNVSDHRLTRVFLGAVEVEDAGEVEELLPVTCQGPVAAPRSACGTDLTKQYYFDRFPPVNETWGDF